MIKPANYRCGLPDANYRITRQRSIRFINHLTLMTMKLPNLMLLSLLSACGVGSLSWDNVNASIEQDFPDVDHVGIDEFTELRDDDSLVIDVRTIEEYQVSHIPGALHLANAAAIRDFLEQNPDNQDKTLLIYCSVGVRSAQVARELQAMEVGDPINFRGSIFAWANAGLPLQNLAGETNEVHPYNRRWGQLLNDSIASANVDEKDLE